MSWITRHACALSVAAIGIAVAAGIVLGIAGPGHRWGWWGVRVTLGAVLAALVSGLVAVVLGALAVVAGLSGAGRGATLTGAAAIVIALGVLALPASLVRAARSVPRIHDITTDTERPPAFVAVLARRRDAPNSAQYAGPGLAAQQRAGYPDLAPADLAAPPARAFASATAAARALGWEIVAEAPSEGRLEATDTTKWWGFKDDVVVRVTARGEGSRIDVRSVSRVGRSDLGVNAARIRRFLAEVRSRAAS